MSAQVPPVNIDDIAARNDMTREEVGEFLTIVKNGMLPEAKIIPVTENGERRYFTVERRGVGPIMTAYGTFWMFDFTIDDQWQKYTVIVKARLDNKTFTPIFDDPTRLVLRTDSGCETGQMFGDLTCECGDQLRLAMEAIGQGGELAIGKGFRVAPFGNRGANLNNGAPNWAARLPHVHFRAPAVKSSTARTGMKWHRPWQTTFRKWFK